jgi:hypothetical protein
MTLLRPWPFCVALVLIVSVPLATCTAYFTVPETPADTPMVLAYFSRGNRVRELLGSEGQNAAGHMDYEVVYLHYVIRDVVPPLCKPSARIIAPSGIQVGVFVLNRDERDRILIHASEEGMYRVQISIQCVWFMVKASKANVTMDAYFEGDDFTLQHAHASLDLADVLHNRSLKSAEPHEVMTAARVVEYCDEIDLALRQLDMGTTFLIERQPATAELVESVFLRVMTTMLLSTTVLVVSAIVQTARMARVFREKKVV